LKHQKQKSTDSVLKVTVTKTLNANITLSGSNIAQLSLLAQLTIFLIKQAPSMNVAINKGAASEESRERDYQQ